MRSYRTLRVTGAALCVALSSFGCNNEDDNAPADVEGDYTLAVTSRDNGCNYANWEEDSSASGIPLSITQDGADISGRFGGAVGLYLDVVLGSRDAEGTVSGNALSMTIYGTNAATDGNCTYTVNATLSGTLKDDVLTGTIQFTDQTNGNPDCASIEGCVSRQEFNGTRPPS